jgi:hypothetical protein
MKGPWKPPPLKLPKPPWKSENMRDVAAMKAWVKERLEVRQSERFNKLYEELKAHGGVEIEENGPVTVVQYKWKELIDMAYEATEKNEAPIEPLREAVRKPIPELADFIHPRKRAVGERIYSLPHRLQNEGGG